MHMTLHNQNQNYQKCKYQKLKMTQNNQHEIKFLKRYDKSNANEFENLIEMDGFLFQRIIKKSKNRKLE